MPISDLGGDHYSIAIHNAGNPLRLIPTERFRIAGPDRLVHWIPNQATQRIPWVLQRPPAKPVKVQHDIRSNLAFKYDQYALKDVRAFGHV